MATQLPAPPTVGSIWNYAGQNYKVVSVEDNFVCLDANNNWNQAIELTDHVAEGETAKVRYVCALDAFTRYFNQGEIEEGAGPPTVDNSLPPESGTKPVEPEEPDAEPKG